MLKFFCCKNCSAKATHIFSAKNIRILYIESAKTVNEMTLNELVKLTMLWTTGPRYYQNLWIAKTQRILLMDSKDCDQTVEVQYNPVFSWCLYHKIRLLVLWLISFYNYRICQMGCYGLGISRILQAGVEVLSTDSEIRWPPLIAPYQICIIPQKVKSEKPNSGPSCSKLTMSLVNDSLKFTLSDTQICWNFLLKKCE